MVGEDAGRADAAAGGGSASEQGQVGDPAWEAEWVTVLEAWWTNRVWPEKQWRRDLRQVLLGARPGALGERTWARVRRDLWEADLVEEDAPHAHAAAPSGHVGRY